MREQQFVAWAAAAPPVTRIGGSESWRHGVCRGSRQAPAPHALGMMTMQEEEDGEEEDKMPAMNAGT
jgi:hypothetical protein